MYKIELKNIIYLKDNIFSVMERKINVKINEYFTKFKNDMRTKVLEFNFDDIVKTWKQPIDILHIDGMHDYKSVKNDFEKWSPFVKENGVIVMHDTMVNKPDFGVNQFFKEINLPKTNFGHCNGLGVVCKDINIINEIKKNFGEFINEI